jgi:hypothetical protein
MANLISTSSPELSATSISSPITQNNGTNPMIEYAGSVFISNGGTANLIANTSGYVRMVGIGHFMAVRTSTSWSFGMFSFHTSRYGTSYSNLLESDWGGYSCSNYQDPNNVEINYLRFTNSSGDSGTFYFNILFENTVSVSSSILTRIK